VTDLANLGKAGEMLEGGRLDPGRGRVRRQKTRPKPSLRQCEGCPAVSGGRRKTKLSEETVSQKMIGWRAPPRTAEQMDHFVGGRLQHSIVQAEPNPLA
jgi:hypothetical protein